MKNALMVILLLAWLPAMAQVAPDKRDVPREYRKELRETVSEYDKLTENWDIVLDPIEAIPTEVFESRAMAFDNWGENLLLPNDLRQRIKAECKGKVVVKIGDTAGAYDHTDLQKGQLPGSNYTTSGLPDVHGHSTHVAGIVGGNTGGLAWELVDMGLLRFKPVKVLSDNGSGSFSWVANAVASERTEDLALLAKGESVIYNFSLGGGTALVPVLETELKKSTDAGVLFVCAAGNSGGPVNYPGMSAYTSATGALQQSLQIASFSSRGPQVTTAMPGVSINSTWKGNTYASLSGTSMASPFAAAAAAIAVSKWGPMPQNSLHAYLSKVSQDIGAPGKDDLFGWGITYVRAILDTPPSGTPPPPPPPPDDPDDPEPPTWPKRVLEIPISGTYTMFWKQYDPPRQEKKEKKREEVLSFTNNLYPFSPGLMNNGVDFIAIQVDEPGVSQLRRLTVESLSVEVETQEETGELAKELRVLTERYFTNRAVYMGYPADFASATWWSAYFYDMILTRQYDGPESLKVLEITGKDEAGNLVRFSGEQLTDIKK